MGRNLECPREECQKKTDGRDGPITHADGTIETAVFKCHSCGGIYTGRQAIAAANMRRRED